MLDDVIRFKGWFSKPNMDFTPVVRRQRAFFHSGATRPLEFRREQLRKLHEAIVAHEPALLEALHADLRKSPTEAYVSEIGLVLSDIRHALAHLPRWMRCERRSAPLLAWPARGFVRPEPYGVALVMSPWNYPVQLALSPLVGAIAAGNCIVLKPSEYAPRTSAALAQLVGGVFPREYLALIEGDRETAEALLQLKFDKIFFTGSTTVGRSVMAAAARSLTPVTLELGGKCPCLVAADARLEVTARRIVWGKYLNAGQTCVAPDFVLVDRRLREALIEAMKQALREFYGADPQRSPAYGRIINRKHFDRLMGYLHSGRIAWGGQHDAEDLYLAPTILIGTPPDAPVMQEEIFGPLLPVLDYARMEEALTFLRDRPSPLALYVFTRDRATQERVLMATRSGGVCINDTITHILGKSLPFGGVGDSGLGAYHGRSSFDAFSHRRSVLRRTLVWDSALRYPPPRVALATLKRVYRFLVGT